MSIKINGNYLKKQWTKETTYKKGIKSWEQIWLLDGGWIDKKKRRPEKEKTNKKTKPWSKYLCLKEKRIQNKTDKDNRRIQAIENW